MRKIRIIITFFLTMILSFQFIGSALTAQTTIQTVNSQGKIVYSPSPTTIKGELYLWVQHWMSGSDSDSEAYRIAHAAQTSGITIWIDSGNWGSPQLTSEFINYFHAHGVKVVCRLWSNGGLNSLDDLLHQMTPRDPIRGSVDYQMSIGPEIDAFMIDECDQYNPSYYQYIASYVHNLGKLLFVNPGGPNLQTSYQWADKVSVEFCWWGLLSDESKQSILAANPQKFIGVSKDYGYHMDSVYDPYIAPKSASGNRPSALPVITLERAIWDTQTAWEGGIFYMAAVPDENSYLPSWWEQYVAALK